MSFRDHLGKRATMVLPYLGGPSVSTPDRRLRVTARVDVGWWRFVVEGRHATAEEVAEPPALDDLPRVRGHLVGDWLFVAGDRAERIFLMPDEEAAPLSLASARRWASGDHLFETIDFDDDAVESARAALLDDRLLGATKGVSPALRAAFGFAFLLRHARRRGLTVSPREVLGRTHEIALGTITPDHFLHELEARHYQRRPHTILGSPVSAGPGHLRAPLGPRVTRGSRERTHENAPERAATVLEAAGAALLDTRSLGGRNLEVVFRFDGERFIAIVDWETLHVYDAGVCLSGHDEELGLDSLPSVIREAVQTHQLHITRR